MNSLQAADGEFDLVCEFAVLHHVPRPAQAVGEMLRVARKAIFISDANNFGQGGGIVRLIKRTIAALGVAAVPGPMLTCPRSMTQPGRPSAVATPPKSRKLKIAFLLFAVYCLFAGPPDPA